MFWAVTCEKIWWQGTSQGVTSDPLRGKTHGLLNHSEGNQPTTPKNIQGRTAAVTVIDFSIKILMRFGSGAVSMILILVNLYIVGGGSYTLKYCKSLMSHQQITDVLRGKANTAQALTV